MPENEPIDPEQLALLKRRKRVANLYLEGRTQWEIAHRLGVNQGTISRDLAAVRREWRASATMDFDKLVQRELAKIDKLELQYTLAWRRSCRDAEIRFAKTRSGADGDTKEASKREEGQSGDPRFLQGIERCIALRAEIIRDRDLQSGKRKTPKQLLEVTGQDGAEIIVKVLRDVSMDDV